jgi:transcriptional regulator with XRE-family HTH domain
MDVRKVLGDCIRKLREEKDLSQNELAEAAGISYQHLSGIENGRENVTIDVLQSIAGGLQYDFFKLAELAHADFVGPGPGHPTVEDRFFRSNVPLPGGLTVDELKEALNETQRIIYRINTNLISIGARPLNQYIQGNNFSGVISNLLCNSMSEFTKFKHNRHDRYPDLISTYQGGSVGLEVKATVQIGKGGESHNAHDGWHLIACFELDGPTGNVVFIHVMMANLHGIMHADPDWTYVGSEVNERGSRRTETYNTTLKGATKLRHGSVYLNTEKIETRRWRYDRSSEIPHWSIFAGRTPGQGHG